ECCTASRCGGLLRLVHPECADQRRPRPTMQARCPVGARSVPELWALECNRFAVELPTPATNVGRYSSRQPSEQKCVQPNTVLSELCAGQGGTSELASAGRPTLQVCARRRPLACPIT